MGLRCHFSTKWFFLEKWVNTVTFACKNASSILWSILLGAGKNKLCYGKVFVFVWYLISFVFALSLLNFVFSRTCFV